MLIKKTDLLLQNRRKGVYSDSPQNPKISVSKPEYTPEVKKRVDGALNRKKALLVLRPGPRDQREPVVLTKDKEPQNFPPRSIKLALG